jgi:hypothetical protein
MRSQPGWGADWRVVRRAIVTLALATTMLESTWLVLGPPDIGESITFFDTGIPTLNAGEAVMVLLAWTVILVAVCAVLISVVHTVAGTHGAHVTSALARILLAAGLVLFVVSAVHRLLPPASICCGSGPTEIREAIDLVQ